MSNLPVDGPHRIGVYPLPGGARIDISHYLTSVILSLAEAAAEDGGTLLEELREIADAHSASTGADSHAAHQRDQLVTDLLDGLGHEGSMTVYGPGVERLADALLRAVRPRLVPGQRGAA
ncbi:hypothetical protein [Streptomyces sp. R33]|uniref:Tetracycline repressor TetR C-terminal domain-containing protein n=1 Tax=Streptomyces sp. R33 TaxID=3238629 RepID=A0AB39Y8I5_9ACTN